MNQPLIPPINFYKDGKLMWLIDTTSKKYSIETIEVRRKGYYYNGEMYYHNIKSSYENYLVYNVPRKTNHLIQHSYFK